MQRGPDGRTELDKLVRAAPSHQRIYLAKGLWHVYLFPMPHPNSIYFCSRVPGID
jgi:hypothetical protein